MATINELIKLAENECQDRKAKMAGFIVALSGTLYTRSVNKNSAVYIECLDKQWQGWRETYRAGMPKAVFIRHLEAGEDFDVVLAKIGRYFDYLEDKRKDKSASVDVNHKGVK
jgi:hypothetical protein